LSLYDAVPATPDHIAIEHRVLALWEQEDTFNRLRAQNAGGPTFSFTDGPITANNSMGVHHAWGRSLKDLIQRHRAMQGHEQRYQNGFDCQGLWVEVEVEKSLGLNSKQEIEAYGLDKFARACRDRVAEYSAVQTRQSKRLGQWMDWDRSYYTMTDPNIEYIWRFLKECHDREMLYRGNRPMVWCPRCGTSLSQHELIDSYRDRTHPTLHVRFPFLDTPEEAVVVWTTTPWTLPANVAAAVDPAAEYSAVRTSQGIDWVMSSRVADLFGEGADVTRTTSGADLVGRRYRGPFDELEPGGAVEHRVVAWDMVAGDEGTGIVHIAPGCGGEDFELGKVEGLEVLVPVDDAGCFLPAYGFLSGLTTDAAADPVREHLERNGVLVRSGTIEHRFPVCWRCGTDLIHRVAEEWFIRAEPVRQAMIDAAATVNWVPEQYGKRMEDWLRNMGDWCISRKRYWGLPLPFYKTESGEFLIIGSVDELRERAVDSLDGLEELHRPWIDGIRVRTDSGEIAERVTEVGDCWLDAGIVPFSTLGWGREEFAEGGYAAGAGAGLTNADLPDHAYWEKWFPADWISEMREQIRLWFYSQLFMSVVLVGKAPYRSVLGYEKLHDETGRAMHKSWGNAIWFDDAIEDIGADVMRWMYALQTPSQNMNFGYGPANEVRRRLLTLWNSYAFLIRYAELDAFVPTYADLTERPPSATALDRWIVARVDETIAACDEALGGYWPPAYARAVEALVDDLSAWYIRGSRARFWRSEGDADKDAAFRTLWYVLAQVCRLIAPAMPFLAEDLWQNLVRERAAGAPDSVHLAGWPTADAPDRQALEAFSLAQTAISLGRGARAQGNRKLRQPLREAVIATPDPAARAAIESLREEIALELNVRNVRIADAVDELLEVEIVPNFKVLGPKLGKDIPRVQQLLKAGDYTREGDAVIVGGHTLEAGEIELRTRPREGFAVADEGGIAVALDTELDEDLEDEGLARELIHFIQGQRKDAGFEVSDRIVIALSGDAQLQRVVARYGADVQRETLCTDLTVADSVDGITFAADGCSGTVAVQRAD
jgi:isoleucyl-tRNA synthetase